MLPFWVTVEHLSRQAGISRQRLNQLVDRGEVPGLTRKSNGRLQIVESPELDRWIAQRRDLKERRETRREELRVRRTSVASPSNGTSFTSKELANQIGCTISSINQRVTKIPNAYFDESKRKFWDEKQQRWRREYSQYRFTDSPELRKWINEERNLKKRPANRVTSLATIVRIHASFKIANRISNTYVSTIRQIREAPLKTWSPDVIQMVIEELDNILELRVELVKELAKRAKK